MIGNCRYIVGDRFEKFSGNSEVVKFSDFVGMLKRKDEGLRSTKYLLGQGIGVDSVKVIDSIIVDKKLENVVSIKGKAFDLFEKKYVHKFKEHNVLLTNPVKLSEKRFVSNMIMDERCAEASDHMTGHHIQGMVLLEAARQMFIGITEAFFLGEGKLGDMYYILKSVNVDYKSFVFPLPVNIVYDISDIEITNYGTINSVIEVNFYQNDILTCTAVIDFSAYSADFMAGVEGKKAKNAIEKGISRSYVLSKAGHAEPVTV